MANNAPATITYNAPHLDSNVRRILQDFVSGQISTGNNKKEWLCGGYYQILDILIDSDTGSVGHNNDIIDININGTSIFSNEGAASTQGGSPEPDYRPFILPGDTGVWKNHRRIGYGYTGATALSDPNSKGIVSGIPCLRPGDIVSYDVDQVGSGNGSAGVKICIVLGDM